MRALWAVYKRELGYFFTSIIAYGIAFGLLLLLGWLFSGQIEFLLQQQQFLQQQGQQGGGVPAADVATSNLDILVFLLFFAAPLLTMRLLAEENREGTLEVLMTLPMNDWAFVTGKFLAAWTFYTFVLLLTGVHVLLLATAATINGGLIVTAYLGAWLYGGAALAVTYVWSAITDEQIVAGFLGAVTVLLFTLLGQLAVLVGEGARITIAALNIDVALAEVMRKASFSAHFQPTLLNGIVRAEDILFYLLVIGISLFITTLLVGSRRWRQS